MSEDATLDQGAPGMDAPNAGQETDEPTPATSPPEQVAEPDAGAGDDTADQNDPPKSKRELAMDLVTANRLRDLEEETGQTLIAPEDSEEGKPAEPRAAKRRVKVDGQDLDVSDEELVREYQKGRTADRRLEQAALARKELEAESARLAAERVEIERLKGQPAAAASGDNDSQATPIGDDTGDRTIYEALVSGDEDEALKAIKKLREGRPEGSTPKTAEIAAQVRQQIAWDEAQAKFSEDYQDIVADPLLREIASNTLIETLKTSESYGQAFREAGNRTRAWVRSAGGGSPQAGGAGAPADPGRAEKEARKGRIDNPTAIGARAAGKPQEQAETPRDVIKQMREARGLPA